MVVKNPDNFPVTYYIENLNGVILGEFMATTAENHQII